LHRSVVCAYPGCTFPLLECPLLPELPASGQTLVVHSLRIVAVVGKQLLAALGEAVGSAVQLVPEFVLVSV